MCSNMRIEANGAIYDIKFEANGAPYLIKMFLGGSYDIKNMILKVEQTNLYVK